MKMNIGRWIVLFFAIVQDCSSSKRGLKNVLPLTQPLVEPFVEQQAMFEDWKLEIGMSFDDPDVEQQVFVQFLEANRKIKHHNERYANGEVPYSMKLSPLAVLSPEEKKEALSGLKLPKDNFDDLVTIRRFRGRAITETNMSKRQPSFPPAPPSLDYRKLGCVTPVLDQGLSCSCCYAFAAQGAIEGAMAIKYGVLKELSKQNLVDCGANEKTGNWGCQGGWMGASYRYIIGNNGVEAEDTYSYKEISSSCKYNSSRSVASLSSYGTIEGDEEHLKRALHAIGPISIAVQSALDSFYYYSTGVYDDEECGSKIDHAVLLVGYGIDTSFNPPKNYWIIKNSWGTEWGENGYIRLERGKNRCGVTKYAVYPVVN